MHISDRFTPISDHRSSEHTYRYLLPDGTDGWRTAIVPRCEVAA